MLLYINQSNKQIYQNIISKKEKECFFLIIQNDIFIKGELGREMYVSVRFFDKAKFKENNF